MEDIVLGGLVILLSAFGLLHTWYIIRTGIIMFRTGIWWGIGQLLGFFFGFYIIISIVFYFIYLNDDDYEEKTPFKRLFISFPFALFVAIAIFISDYTQSQYQKETYNIEQPSPQTMVAEPAQPRSVATPEPPAIQPKQAQPPKPKPVPPKQDVQDINDEIIKMVGELQKDLPIMVDEYTQITKATAGNNKITFYYKVTNLERDNEIEQDVINNEIKDLLLNSGICSNKNQEFALKLGIAFTFRYYDAYDDYLGEATITKQDCQ